MSFSAIAIFGAAMSTWIGNHLISQSILTVFVFYMLTGDRPTLAYAQCKTIKRDLLLVYRYSSLTILLLFHEKLNHSVAQIFSKTVQRHPNKRAFTMADKSITFREGEDLSNKIGEYFYKQGYQKGDTVALLMENCLEYPFFWLGLSKIGVISALINTNLKKDVLLNSIKVANCRAIITSADFVETIREILYDEELQRLPIYVYKGDTSTLKVDPNMVDLVQEFHRTPANKRSFDPSKIQAKDKLLYIYTSGTTGLPKAAVITNLRFMFLTFGVSKTIKITSQDTIYNPLPMYHSVGGILGVGAVLLGGSSMAIRKKFSASNYWTDCIKYKCTVAQYIGELCRFVLLVPPKPTDSQHRVRMMCGNGLRPHIWSAFMKR